MTRQIDNDAAYALLQDRYLNQNNTKVDNLDETTTVMTLYSDRIAKYMRGTGALHWTLAGYNTLTTRSRINGILDRFGACRVTTANGQPYFVPSCGPARPIDVNKWYVQNGVEVQDE